MRLRARVLPDRRLGALGRRFNDCPECVQIIRFCLRGAERAKTFIAGRSFDVWATNLPRINSRDQRGGPAPLATAAR
jgi:hypothetical protein